MSGFGESCCENREPRQVTARQKATRERCDAAVSHRCYFSSVIGFEKKNQLHPPSCFFQLIITNHYLDYISTRF